MVPAGSAEVLDQHDVALHAIQLRIEQPSPVRRDIHAGKKSRAFGTREYNFPASRSEAEELNRVTRGWTFNEVNPVVCEGPKPQLPSTQHLPFFAAIDRDHPDTGRPLIGHVIEMLAVRRLERL